MLNIYTYLLFAGFGLFAILDWLMPARDFPAMPWWKIRGVVSAVLYVALASYSPYLWAEWMAGHQLLDASGWPVWLAVPVGYVVLQFFGYWWHRALHRFDLLWRYLHQMHHSAERMDVYGALYFSPLDTVGFTFAGSFALVMVLGISPLAAAVTGVIAGLISLFTHANLATPRWIGHFVARPEYHALHHQRGRHTGNFGELTLWDRVFGTFTNPARFDGEVGFWDGASSRILAMLAGRDVSRPPSPPRSRGRGGGALGSVVQLLVGGLVLAIPLTGWAVAVGLLITA